jgi:hypothetical protein
MTVNGFLLIASNLFLTDMERLHTYIRPLELAYVEAMMGYPRVSSQSLLHTLCTWTFPGLTGGPLH